MFDDIRQIIAPHSTIVDAVLAALAGPGGAVQALGALVTLLEQLTGGEETEVAWWVVGGASSRARDAGRPVTREDLEWALALHCGDVLVAAARERDKQALARIRRALGLPADARPDQVAEAVERMTHSALGAVEIRRAG